MRKENAAVTFVKQVQAAFAPLQDPERALAMSKYLRDQFPFLGIPTPAMTQALDPLIRELAKPNASDTFAATTARALWKLPQREYHHAAAYLLYKIEKSLTPVSLPLLRQLIETKSWWDSVDALATRCVGPLVKRYELQSEMDTWSKDPNFWIRRTAILHQLGYREKTDTQRLFAYCLSNAHDQEFFIRKAIGWALRQYARTDAKAVQRFVKAHLELSTLSKKEALKHCS